LDSLGSLIDSCLLRSTKKNYWQIRLIAGYPKVVGKIISSNTKLLFQKEGQAVILCRNSIWMNELKNRESELVEKFNQFLGKNLIQGIIVKIGNIEKQKPKTQSRSKAELSVEEKDWITQTKSLVPEPLQARFESVLIAYKELKK